MKRAHSAVLLLLSLALAGCRGTNLGRYGSSRALDFMDSIPVSVGGGLGLLAEVRATPFVGLGIGYADMVRAGIDDQRFGPLWTEKERGYPIVTYYRIQAYVDREDRWSGGDANWRDEEYRGRGSSWIILPAFPRDGESFVPLPGPLDKPERELWNFDPWLPFTPPYVQWVAYEWPLYSWVNILNVEVGVDVGVVGLRVGVSPIQLLDFVGGIFLFDFARDDVREYPTLWPDPEAETSFPETMKKPPPPKTTAAPAAAPAKSR